MIIDGHAHSCGDFYDADNVVRILDKLKVDKIVLCPGPLNDQKKYNFPMLTFNSNKDIMLFLSKIIRLIGSLLYNNNDLSERNAFVHSMVGKYPDRIIQFLWINPSSQEVLSYMKDTYSAWNYAGIKAHQCFEKFDSSSSTMHSIAEFCQDKGIPFFIHFYSLKDIDEFIALATKYPNTNFIVGHLIGLELFEIHKDKINNVYFDISPTPYLAENRILRVIRAFGADRIIFGSDTPYGTENLKNGIDKINSMNISSQEREKIMGLNIRKRTVVQRAIIKRNVKRIQ